MHVLSDNSLFWLIPWAIVSFLAAKWLYANNAWFLTLGKTWRYLLVTIRTIVLFSVGALLLGMLFESTTLRIEKPIIVSVVDNSSSMLNYKDSAKVKPTILAYQNELRTVFSEAYDLVEMHVDDQVNYSKQNPLNGLFTNLSAAFEKINTDYYTRNIGGIILLSDGNFNKGIHPIYSAEKLKFTPVYTLGVGDTLSKKDQLIKNVSVNEVAFYKNVFPIEVDLEGIKMGAEGAIVSVSKNGKVIAKQAIRYKNSSHDYQHLNFEVDANEIGFQTYTVQISSAKNELNYTNNKRVFYIEVIDSRNKILLLANAPHPDIAAMKQVLEADLNNQVSTALMKDWNKDVKGYNLIVWHDPSNGFDPTLVNSLQQNKIPVLYFIGPSTSNSIVQKLNIGITVSGKNFQADELQGVYNKGFQQFEVSPETQEAISFFPPLKSKFGTVTTGNDLAILLYQRLGQITKSAPLVYFQQKEGRKNGVVFGEGIWRWKINDYTRTKSFDHFSELISKTVQYLVVKENGDQLKVTMPKRFTKAEEVVVNASFYNESMDPITSPMIDFKLVNSNGKMVNNQFSVIGDFYKLNLGKLTPGKYTWFAKTNYNSKVFKKSGVFIVEDIGIEDLDNAANHSVLKQLSKGSNGTFYTLKNYRNLIEDLKNRKDITSVSYEEISFNDLIDYKLIFFLLLVLVSAEWFLRRWFGAY